LSSLLGGHGEISCELSCEQSTFGQNTHCWPLIASLENDLTTSDVTLSLLIVAKVKIQENGLFQFFFSK